MKIPYNFTPRTYQIPFLKAMDEGCKRAVTVWHRRAGKDKTLLNFTVKRAMERVGAYYYYFPTMSMGRKIIWDGIDKEGFPFLGHIPAEIQKAVNNQEMKIKFVNGSLFQIIGTDRLEVVGTNPVGCVFSEYSLQNPKGWSYIRPILAENGGWAVFNFTPRGKNHGYKIFEMAQQNPKWFCQLLTVDDTNAISREAIQDDRDEGMSEEMVQQEYYCSWELGISGAYYARAMSKALNEGRICSVPYDDSTPVFTFWDLGISDSMAIWFLQFCGREIHWIDYYENTGQGFPHYKKMLDEKGYLYGGHYAPHDISQRELATGMSRLDAARDIGINFERVPAAQVSAGIEALRGLLSRCWFDSTKCEQGINCLQNYHEKYNEKLNIFLGTPEHDWTSHGADAARTFATAYKQGLISYLVQNSAAGVRRPVQAQTDFDVLG